MDYESILNKRIAAVPKSGIRRFFDMASEMKDVISLGVGEPDFVTPFHIRSAAINSLLDGQTSYTANAGLLQLREEIAYYLKTRMDVSYDPKKEIIVTVGASEGIDISLRAICTAGDEVLVPEPSYVSYMPGVVFAGGTPVAVPTSAENGFKLTPEQLKNAITPRTRALILPYPNNPTGGILSNAEMEELAAVLRGTNIIVISDEIYSELNYTGERMNAFASIEGMRERTITLNGFSKAFAMTGWRVGYLCAPEELFGIMLKIHQYTALCAPRQGQVAAIEALRAGRENDYADVAMMRESYDRRRRLMVDSFHEMGLKCFEPRGAFYIFPSFEHLGLTSEEFCTRLINEKHIAAVPGTAFGATGEYHMRCCYATAIDKLRIALTRIAELVKDIEQGK
ncbi:MAG: aminotransferase class I/II-fold pyridoxal phosphate-dependent enzyme [Eubacteriales bacterium]|nr:aminotransferase class I/II-fold pyridoxal phosphate-dependent enzyme [Eubacteriales bacterium]MDD3880959.1 aminotransferase class I/II-fold pyridoxal phosphate-dependent enzyme [Eubacteriales bacterium]MDD4511972.1 aminotransferase class I/II-fold pyridoxal phosphate-dependent enzyme [Eubacteriales bacterium]